MEHDNDALTAQLTTLTKQYNTNSAELKRIRSEKQNTQRDLEAKLSKQIEELDSANRTITDLQESNQTLQKGVDQLLNEQKENADRSAKLLHSSINELIARSNAIKDGKKRMDELHSSESSSAFNHTIKNCHTEPLNCKSLKSLPNDISYNVRSQQC